MLQEGVAAAQHCERIRIGNVWFDRLTFGEALDAIERLVEARAGGAVFTPNVDHVVQAESDPSFRAASARASLNLVDGQPLVWASRIIGHALPEKISGSDLVEPLMDRARARGWRVFLLGGLPGAAVKAAARFSREGVTIAGIEDGHVSLFDGPSLASRIVAARPQLLLVALGAPKQELWIHAYRDLLAPAVALGVGASLDFIAGAIRRAPRWMQRAGLEWLYRLAREPKRLMRRYLWKDPRFIAVLLRTWLSPRHTRWIPAQPDPGHVVGTDPRIRASRGRGPGALD